MGSQLHGGWAQISWKAPHLGSKSFKLLQIPGVTFLTFHILALKILKISEIGAKNPSLDFEISLYLDPIIGFLIQLRPFFSS